MKRSIILFNFFIAACMTLQGNEPAPPNTRNQDLRVILNNTSLSPKVDLYFNMLIANTAAQMGKTVDAEAIIKKLRDSVEDEAVFSKFAAQYSVFSNEEIHEIRKIYENSTFIKYIDFSTQNMQPIMELLQGLITELVEKAETVKKDENNSSSSEVIELTSENFQQEVLESEKPIIIDIYSTKCPPCRLMEPIIEELRDAYKEQVRFAKINCETQAELAQKYGVTSLPTLLFIKPGEDAVFMKSIGFTSKKDFETKIAALLEDSEC